MARTAQVTLQARFAPVAPKAVRFEGQTFKELKARLAEVRFPGYDEYTFVAVKDKDGQYVCFLDEEELPSGDLDVLIQKAHGGGRGISMRPDVPFEFQPTRPSFLPPSFGGPPEMKHGHHRHLHGRDHDHQHSHHHHDKHGKGKGDFSAMRLGRDAHHTPSFSWIDYFTDMPPAEGPPSPPHRDGPHHRHRKHGHSKSQRGHSPGAKHGSGDDKGHSSQDEHQGMARASRGHRSGDEEGKHYGKFGARGGCNKGGRCGRRGGHGWVPSHCRGMMGPFGHHGGRFFHRGRSHSPFARMYGWRHPQAQGIDLPDLARMTLNSNDAEAYTEADPAYQIAIARSYMDRSGAEEEEEQGHDMPANEEDWQELGMWEDAY